MPSDAAAAYGSTLTPEICADIENTEKKEVSFIYFNCVASIPPRPLEVGIYTYKKLGVSIDIRQRPARSYPPGLHHPHQ
jgi:hypothetical protein